VITLSDFLVGEALIGSGKEVAHLDVLIGSKKGPVGHAFASGLTNPRSGHTPILAVIKPNLMPKPPVLLIPKVTLKKTSQIGFMFGAAQAAIGRAVADAVEEGIIPRNKVDDWVIICSVFVDPAAQDEHKIHYWNYGACKLALRRAIHGYPSIEKILAEKDRAKHPIMNFYPQTLWAPPYLQIALDTTSLAQINKVVSAMPKSDRIIFECGTPIIKEYGLGSCVETIRKVRPGCYCIADMKTMDVGRAEVKMASQATANAVVVSGKAPLTTITEFITECNKHGIHHWIDSLGMTEEALLEMLRQLPEKPKVVILHRGIDQEQEDKSRQWGCCEDIREITNSLIALAGGLVPGEPLKQALKTNADIFIVGRYIYQSPDPYNAAQEFLRYLGPDKDTMRLFDRIDY
jgi:bifunctional enzyme Fae/Hps